MARNLALVLFLLLVCPVCAAGAAGGQPLWLTVVGTGRQAEEGLALARELAGRGFAVFPLDSADCTNLKPGLVVLATYHGADRRVATERLMMARRNGAADAYLRECALRPGTLAWAGIPLFHQTLVVADRSFVNWDADDLRARMQALPGAGWLVAQYTYDATDPEDVLEGVRTTLALVDDPLQPPRLLLPHCLDWHAVQQDGLLLVACVTEQAAGLSVHDTFLFSLPDLVLAAHVKQCGSPAFQTRKPTCRSEIMSGEGNFDNRLIPIPQSAIPLRHQ